MHVTLTQQANRRLIACWAGFEVLVWILTSGQVAACAGLGAALGVVGGLLQRSVLVSHAREFAQAKTALDVRRVFTSSQFGAISIALGWICLATLLVLSLALALRQPISPTTPLSLSGNLFAGYFAFMLLRDGVAYSALRHVAAAESPSNADP